MKLIKARKPSKTACVPLLSQSVFHSENILKKRQSGHSENQSEKPHRPDRRYSVGRRHEMCVKSQYNSASATVSTSQYDSRRLFGRHADKPDCGTDVMPLPPHNICAYKSGTNGGNVDSPAVFLSHRLGKRLDSGFGSGIQRSPRKRT